MQFSPAQTNRLKTLLAWRRNPPTMSRMLPKMIMLVLVWAGLVIAFGVLAGGVGSPLMYYCLGVASFFPLLGIVQARQTISRWQVTEAIVDWPRVESMVATANG